MTELRNISLDLLFRIDFGALVAGEEEGDEEEVSDDPTELLFPDESDQEEIDAQIKALKEKYAFPRLYQRVFSYVRMADAGENHTGYLAYCADLAAGGKFGCPQLEQAIGLFENGELKAFLSADTGTCYNTRGHLDALEEIFRNDESDIFGVHTFYAEVVVHQIRLLYAPHSNMIDVDASGNEEFLFNRLEFRKELDALAERVGTAFAEIRTGLKAMKPGTISEAEMDQVFSL